MDNYSNNEFSQEPKKSWWKRNWKWVVPTGCLGLIILVCIVLGSAIFSFVNLISEESGGDEALTIVQQNEEIIKLLGEPIEKNGFGSFNVSTSNGFRKAEANFPIKGPNGEGHVYIKSHGKGEAKIYDTFEVTVGDTLVLDLRPERSIELE
ncbi:MAG: hypothetical protein CL868_12250 [Cytophagaceae bacterium]|nr:hypothetical protein [Cytophagaceae bacterium]|tara:strand:- start:4650 stop:5102 length:453 start_codon:yes stop_codon:yes gene_type:complete